MKKMNLVLALALSALSASAFAADSGFYAGAKVGMANTSMSSMTLSTSGGVGYGLVGGYQITPNVAVEAEYLNLSKIATATSPDLPITGYGVSAVGLLPINADFSAIGKLGFTSTKVDISSASTLTANKTGLSYGLGGQYNINSDLVARAEYTSYAVGESDSTGTGTTSLISIGVLAKF